MKYLRITSYKYETVSDEYFYLPLLAEAPDFATDRYCLTNGSLIIYSGFMWDGTSGPTIDTKNTMIPGLVHDVLYRAIREGFLDPSFKPVADTIFRDLMLTTSKKSLWARIRANYFYQGVNLFGFLSIKPRKEHEVLSA